MEFKEIIQSDHFLEAIESLDVLDIISTNLVDLGVLINSRMPKSHRLSEAMWKLFIFDNAVADIKVLDEYLEARQQIALKFIEAKKDLFKTLREEQHSYVKMRGAETQLKVRFPNHGIVDQAPPVIESPKIPTHRGIVLLPLAPSGLTPPPDAKQAALDAEMYTDFEEQK